MKRIPLIFLLVCLSAAATEPDSKTNEANTQTSPTIDIELNRLEQSKNDTCITYFMLKNNTAHTYTGFKTELIIFDKKDIISTRVLGDFKKVRPGKTVVKLFGIPNTRCDAIGKVLINDVHQCMVGETEQQDCLDLLKPDQKSTTLLFK